MVSLEKKLTYQQRIKEIPKLAAFNDLLLGKVISIPDVLYLNETDKIYFGIINAIQSNNSKAFLNNYNKKSKSNPSKESPSPFVNDDFLIFCLIVGIIKFKCDKTWIESIISIRVRNSVTITFENILNENFYSKSNLPEIVVMHLQLNNRELLTNDILSHAFIGIFENTNLFESKNDFQILCAINTYEIIICLKEAADSVEMKLVNEFILKFSKRIRILSWLIQTLILTGLLYSLFTLISINPQFKKLFDKIGSVLKILGYIGLSQLINLLPIIKIKLTEILMRIFGYPKELLIRKRTQSEFL